MVYQGGKWYQRKYILPIIEKEIRVKKITDYYEPFCGGCNIIYNIPSKINRYANDIDKNLIEFYEYVQNGGEPLEDVDKTLFDDMRDNPEKYEAWQLGSVNVMASYGAKGFQAGYGGKDNRTGNSHYKSALIRFKTQIPFLKNINFSSVNYQDLKIKDGSFVYCDPPYRNTLQYYNKKFNYDDYDNWVKELSKRCYVLCSEYKMPEDFICIQEMPIRKKKPSNENVDFIIDKLFVYKEGMLYDDSN